MAEVSDGEAACEEGEALADLEVEGGPGLGQAVEVGVEDRSEEFGLLGGEVAVEDGVGDEVVRDTGTGEWRLFRRAGCLGASARLRHAGRLAGRRPVVGDLLVDLEDAGLWEAQTTPPEGMNIVDE